MKGRIQMEPTHWCTPLKYSIFLPSQGTGQGLEGDSLSECTIVASLLYKTVLYVGYMFDKS